MKKILTICLALSFSLSQAQLSIELEDTILGLDSLFWQAYNECAIDKMAQFVNDDVEFYHDNGGLTQGRENLVKSLEKNLCSDSNFGLRRAAVTGTVQVFPMNKYGAIISGQHVFYVRQGDNPEFLDGQARFTHLWKEEEGKWTMTRILSYDHGPAIKNPPAEELVLPVENLAPFVGSYLTSSGDEAQISLLNDQLHLRTDQMEMTLYALSESKFYSKEAPLTFDFVESSQGVVEKMIVNENGKPVDEALKK